MLKLRRIAYDMNRYKWGIQWFNPPHKISKVYVFGKMNRIRVSLWWNILYYRHKGIQLHASAKGM